MLNVKQLGVEAGYAAGLPSLGRRFLPDCPHDLYVRDENNKKVRNPEHDAWLQGWQLGQALLRRHQEDLSAMVEAVKTIEEV